MFKQLKVSLVVALLLCSVAPAGAALLVSSIDLSITNTTYDTTSAENKEKSDNEAYRSAIEAFDTAFANSGQHQSLNLLDPYNSQYLCEAGKNCAINNRNFASKLEIRGSAEAAVDIQFGVDWDRGGLVILQQGGSASMITRFSENLWWARDWENQDVLNLALMEGSFSLTLIGFEGCCDGINQARYQQGASGWQAFVVNDATNPANVANSSEVAAPVPVLTLGLGLGLLIRLRKESI